MGMTEKQKRFADEYLIDFYDIRCFKVWNYKYTGDMSSKDMIVNALAILIGDYNNHRKFAALYILKALVRDKFLECILNDSRNVYPFQRHDKRVYRWTKEVLARGKCELCGSPMHLEAHHVLKWSDFPPGRADSNNGMCLCHSCHTNEHRYDQSYHMMKVKKY